MRLKDHTPVVLIVGGGYAGAALTIRMLERWRTPLHVVIAEPRSSLGRGEAYSSTETVHLMNGPAGNFSIHPQDLSHLARWVERTYDKGGITVPAEGAANLYIPRNLFGDYVNEELLRAIDGASPDMQVTHWQSLVVRLRGNGPAGFNVEFADGRQLRVDKVILATGVFPLADDPILVPLAGDWRLVKPWHSSSLDRLAHARDVMIIGASLSMVDTVASLEARGFRGRYHVFSRRGHLIEPTRDAGDPVTILNPAALPRTARQLLAAVIDARRKALANGRDWQVLPLSLRPHILPLWQGATTTERLRFIRHLRSLWDVTAHRSAPRSYAALDAVRNEGRFDVSAARLVSVFRENDRLRVKLRPRGSANAVDVDVDAIVDARGHQEHDWQKIKSPLVQDLLQSGIVRRHQTGFGIDATQDARIIGAEGFAHDDLYAIGHPLRGVAWESSSLTELRHQADALAEQLSKDLSMQDVFQNGLAVG